MDGLSRGHSIFHYHHLSHQQENGEEKEDVHSFPATSNEGFNEPDDSPAPAGKALSGHRGAGHDEAPARRGKAMGFSDAGKPRVLSNLGCFFVVKIIRYKPFLVVSFKGTPGVYCVDSLIPYRTSKL